MKDAIEVNDRVHWEETVMVRGRKMYREIIGTVTATDGPNGRLIVDVDGEDKPSHIQPSFVEKMTP